MSDIKKKTMITIIKSHFNKGNENRNKIKMIRN